MSSTFWGINNISKKVFNKYGEKLVNDRGDESALKQLNDFRYFHRSIVDDFEKIVFNHYNNNFPHVILFGSWRLKRTASIIDKLERIDKMMLSRMQDIVGIRFVFNNIENIYHFKNRIQNNNPQGFTLIRDTDYIKNIKEDGYRGVHLVFQSDSGLYLELQLRTDIQHYWATTVEIIDFMENTTLKIGGSDIRYKKFLIYASIYFESLEELKYNKSRKNKAKKEIKRLNDKYQITYKLRKFNIQRPALNNLFNFWSKSDANISGEYILIMDLDNRKTEFETYESLVLAQNRYLELEKKYIDNDMIDIVHVSANFIERSYPNYFGDSKQFVDLIEKLINK